MRSIFFVYGVLTQSMRETSQAMLRLGTLGLLLLATACGSKADPVCEGCDIDGVCHATGEFGTACTICDPVRSPSAWSDNDGVSCDDGVFCNGPDQCEAGACAASAGDPCGDDLLFCNGTESCSESERSCLSSGSPCSATDVCSEDLLGCCTEEASRGCDASNDAVWFDSCGRVGALIEDCVDAPAGVCAAGVCSCAVGWTGDACTECVVHVDTTGDDESDGLQWITSVATLGRGLELAEMHGCEIWVVTGTYLPGDARTDTFQLFPTAELYGGFEGGETERDARSPVAAETILSGDIGVGGDAADNVLHVVTGADGALIDGFIIEGGQADDMTSFETQSGGGIQLDGVATTVIDCVFRDNFALMQGGAISGTRSASDIRGSTFLRNRSTRGGAIGAVSSTLRISDSSFQSNSVSEFGGAVSFFQGTPVIRRSAFTDNTAQQVGGAIADDQSGMFVVSSTFTDNESDFGGGVAMLGSTGTIANSVFRGNIAGFGGGVGVQDESPSILSCTFNGNGEAWGGALYNNGGTPTLFNSVLWGNSGIGGTWQQQIRDENDGRTDARSNTIEGLNDASHLWAANSICRPEFDAMLRLGASSTCIDAGDSSWLPNDRGDVDDDGDTSETLPLDVEGNARIMGSAVDFGAFESGS